MPATSERARLIGGFLLGRKAEAKTSIDGCGGLSQGGVACSGANGYRTAAGMRHEAVARGLGGFRAAWDDVGPA